MDMTKKKVGLLGAGGYVARELVRLLLNHPNCRLEHIVSESSIDGKEMGAIFPGFRRLVNMTTTTNIEALGDCDVILTSKPDIDSLKNVPVLVEDLHRRVIDMSAAYRFKNAQVYKDVYMRPHNSEHLLKQAVYGLTEIHRDKVKNANLVANPGCYPVSVILGCAPLIKNQMVDPGDIVVDSYSGVTGAGANPENPNAYLFSELDGNMKPYKVCEHRHYAEMEQELGFLSQWKATITFVPHLAPLRQGILSSIYLKLRKTGVSVEELRGMYIDFYGRDYFVRIMDVGEAPTIQNVVGTNFCDIGIFTDRRTSRVVILSAIDNLIKGAAGQAIQNLNVMLGLDETAGLTGVNVEARSQLPAWEAVEQFLKLPTEQ